MWILSDGRKLVIVPDLRADHSVSQLVDDSLVEFDRLKDRQAKIRQIGFLTLGVLTFLLIFASSWTAFYIARGLTVPIKALAQGAEEIARGNLSHRVRVLAEDELALLVATFNEMSQKLEENSEEIGERKRYIETLLESLPTGVISFDAELLVGTANAAAVAIMGLGDRPLRGRSIAELVAADDFEVLERVIVRARRAGQASEQAFLRHNLAAGDSNLPVMLTASVLPASDGVVLVIEDLSDLIAAQRAAAWREVAKRMAHEIKNPLTPIQLSAERIAKRFAQAEATPSTPGITRAGSTSDIVRDGTDTILREVSSLKAMVDEFSRFARLPEIRPESRDLNEIVLQVVTLFEDQLENARLETDLAADLPETLVDPEQIKRVFVNLIQNSIEAFDGSKKENIITVRTSADPGRGRVAAVVSDNGVGIAATDFGRLFQPYFSTKSRGTGLGLAIVHRIISDHGGTIRAEANNGRGVRFIIELPSSARP
jgi:PAS domain S-box-containing protein